MARHLHQRLIVGDHKTVESPLLPQHIGEQPAVARGRNAVDKVERSHEAASPGVNSRAVGREITVVHSHAAHVHGVVVLARLDGPVEREMLDASHYVGLARIVALIAPHHGPGYARAEIRVFAAAFGHAPPARIHADVYHRAVSPVDAVGTCLLGGYARRALYGQGVPAARHRQRYWEDGLVAMHHVHAHEQRYAQSRLLDGNVLQLAYLARPFHIEHTSHPARGNAFRDGRRLHRAGGYVAGHLQSELPNLFFNGHFLHERAHKLVHLTVLRGAGEGCRRHDGCQ